MDMDALVALELEALASCAGNENIILERCRNSVERSVAQRIAVQEAKGEPFVPGQGVNAEFLKLYCPLYAKPLAERFGKTHGVLAGIEGSKYAPPYFAGVYPNVDVVGFAAIGGVEAKDAARAPALPIPHPNPADSKAAEPSDDSFPVLCLQAAGSDATATTTTTSLSPAEVLRLACTASRELVEETGILITPLLMLDMLRRTDKRLPGSGEPLLLYTGASPYYEHKTIVVFTLVVMEEAEDDWEIVPGKIARASVATAAAAGSTSEAASVPLSKHNSEPFVVVHEATGAVLASADGDGVVITHPKYLGREVRMLRRTARASAT